MIADSAEMWREVDFRRYYRRVLGGVGALTREGGVPPLTALGACDLIDDDVVQAVQSGVLEHVVVAFGAKEEHEATCAQVRAAVSGAVRELEAATRDFSRTARERDYYDQWREIDEQETALEMCHPFLSSAPVVAALRRVAALSLRDEHLTSEQASELAGRLDRLAYDLVGECHALKEPIDQGVREMNRVMEKLRGHGGGRFRWDSDLGDVGRLLRYATEDEVYSEYEGFTREEKEEIEERLGYSPLERGRPAEVDRKAEKGMEILVGALRKEVPSDQDMRIVALALGQSPTCLEDAACRRVLDLTEALGGTEEEGE